MDHILKDGSQISLPKKEDKIIKQLEGKIEVECKAKKGQATYEFYYKYPLLIKEKGQVAVLKAWNYLERTFAVNAVNLPDKEGSSVKRQYKTDREGMVTKEEKESYDKKVVIALEKVKADMIAEAEAKAKAEKK